MQIQEKFGDIVRFFVKLHKKGYLVVQYDLKMNFIKIWESSGTAEKALKLKSIYDNICGKTKQCGGFIWKKL